MILPALATHVAKEETQEIKDTIGFSIRLTCFVCFPVTAGLWLTRNETISLLFERGTFDTESTGMTAFALNFHIIGLTFIALTRVFVPVFYAYKDTWRPLWAAVVSMVVNIAACYLLTPYLDQGGIALANTLSAGAQLIVLMALMGAHIRVSLDGKTLASILRSLVATVVMAAAIVALQDFFNTSGLTGFTTLVLPYSVILITSVAVFALTCVVVRHPELTEIAGIVRRRRK